MKKLIFMDIDGTLVDPKTHQIPNSALEAMQQAKRFGHRLFLCTGRSFAQIQEFMHLDVDGYICCAGAYVRTKEAVIYQAPFSANQIETFQQLFNEQGVEYNLEGERYCYLTQPALTFFKNMYAKHENTISIDELIQNKRLVGLENYSSEDVVCKACMFTQHHDDIRALQSRIGDDFSLLETSPKRAHNGFYYAELTHAHITKLQGIERIVQVYDVALQDCVAIGDTLNDFDMVEGCGIGIAMGNAVVELKESANFITTNAWEDGIAHAFRFVQSQS
ncbi:MAG: HAD family hydrolase [Erysipelotrichaceae bacterium]